MGIANWYVAFHYSLDTWVNFKVWGGIGLFLINMLIVWLTAAIVPGFDANGFWPIAKAAVVIWLVNALLGGFWPEKRRDDRGSVWVSGSF